VLTARSPNAVSVLGPLHTGRANACRAAEVGVYRKAILGYGVTRLCAQQSLIPWHIQKRKAVRRKQ